MMRILGVDPGYGIIGYSIMEYKNNKFKLIKADSIQTKPNSNFNERLCVIYSKLNEIIKEFNPNEAAVETLYFNKNTKTAIEVAEARGVILLALKQFNLNIGEYTPLQIKQAVTGYGRAEKKQVQQMLLNVLCLEKVPKLDDITDAMAVAVCHAHSSGSLLNGLK